MSFGFDAVKTSKPESWGITESTSNTPYGVQSAMTTGLGGIRKTLGTAHPLEKSERNFNLNKERMEMLVLRNTQGLHAPMRLAMELKSASKVGRLPFLPSSNVMRDVILGRDQDIGFEDILNTSEFREKAGQPHAVVEKSLNIL